MSMSLACDRRYLQPLMSPSPSLLSTLVKPFPIFPLPLAPLQVVAPKRAALAEAEAAYAAVLSGLQAKQAELAELEARLAGLEARLAESQERKQRLEVGRCARGVCGAVLEGAGT